MAITVGELEAKLHADVASFVAGMKQAADAFTNTSKTIQQGSASMGSLQTAINGVQNGLGSLNSKLNKTFGLIGAGFIMPKIFMAAKSAVIDFNQQVDQATVALTNFLGSGSAAKDMITELQDFAARTPFQFQDLLGTTQSMMAMGVAADEVLPRMEAIGDAAAAMGGSPEVLQRIQRALGQIQAKGRVQSEELLQLAEAGIPAYQYMADALGKSTADMLNDMRKGTVDSATAISAILDGMSRDFGGMMEEQSKTMMGAMSTVMDYVQITVGAIFRPFFESLRDAFVAISELLSSEGMKSAASNFAKSVASVITSVKSLIGAFSKTLAKPFMDLMKAMGNLVTVGVRLATALKPMVTAILIPMAGAVALVANAIGPLVGMLAGLAEVISRNQVVMYAFAALLTAKFITGFGASGKAASLFTNTMSKLFSTLGKSGKDASVYFRVLRAEGTGAFQSIKIASQTAGLSIKAFGMAIKTALIELLPLMLAFMAIGKAMQAFSDRNKDAQARTEELTNAIKEQTDAILASEDALTSLAKQGLDPLNKALVETGTEGEETTNALIALGKSSDSYLQTMRDFKTNTEDAAYALAKQKGFTEEQAKQMAQFVKHTDKGTDAQHRAQMQALGFTQAMIDATMNLEQLDDASENTNFAKMTQNIINATIRSNEATQQFYDQAKATVTAAKAAGEKMSADEEAIKVYELFVKLSGDYEEQQKRIANTQEMLGQSTETVTERMMALITSMKDGKVETEDFLRALMGSAKYAQTNASQAYFDMGVALDQFGKGLKETKGNQNALMKSGYDFRNMLAQNQATILGMGGTLGDVDSAMVQMIDTFYKQGQAAGWSKDALVKVLQTMGLLKENGDIILTVDVRIKGLEELRKTAIALGDTQMFNAITKQLYELNQQKNRSLNLDLKSINLGDGKGGAKKQTKTLKELRQAIREVYEEGLAKAKQKIEEAKAAQEDYARSISNTITGLVSLSDAYSVVADGNNRMFESVKGAITSLGQFTGILNEQTSATNALTQAQKAQTDAQSEVVNLQNEQLRLIAKYKRATTRDEQLNIQDEIARNTEALTRAEEKLADAKKATADAEAEQNKVGKSFLEGLRNRVQAAKDFAKQIQELRDLGLGENALSQIISAGAESGGQMAKELIDGAKNGLDSIGETNRLLGELDSLGETVGKNIADSFYNAGSTGASATLKAMMDKADEATKFAEKIKTLVSMGLSEENLQNVLDAGATAGTKIADQLIAGGEATINQANKITEALKSAADAAGASAAGKYYDAGVKFAQAIYDGLKAQWDALKPQIEKMTGTQLQTVLNNVSVTVPAYVDQTQPTPSIMQPAPAPAPAPAPPAPALNRQYWRDRFLAIVNRELGTKFKQVNDYIKAGATAKQDKARQKRWDDYVIANNVPALANGGIVNRATLALIGEKGPEAVIPLSDMGSGETNFNITVHAGLGTNGQQVGQQIVNELIAWQRRNGSLPVRVQG